MKLKIQGGVVFLAKYVKPGRNFGEKQHILHLTVGLVACQRIQVRFSKFTFLSLTKLPVLHSYGETLQLDSNSSGSKEVEAWKERKR